MLPALNEENTIALVLEGLPEIVDEVVLVDGGSNDETIAIAREVRPDAVVVRQTRSGKGNALACGFAAAGGDIVVTLNADGSTDPGEIPRYVDALLSGAEVAHGSRYRTGGRDLDGGRWDRLGSRILNWLVNALFGTRFTDIGFGYNAFWRSMLPTLDLPSPERAGLPRGATLWGDGPEIRPLINIRTATRGMRVVEVASIGYPRIHGPRERHRLWECLRALRTVATEYADRDRATRPRHGTSPATDPVRGQTGGRTVGVRPAVRIGGARSPGGQSRSGRSENSRFQAGRSDDGWSPFDRGAAGRSERGGASRPDHAWRDGRGTDDDTRTGGSHSGGTHSGGTHRGNFPAFGGGGAETGARRTPAHGWPDEPRRTDEEDYSLTGRENWTGSGSRTGETWTAAQGHTGGPGTESSLRRRNRDADPLGDYERSAYSHMELEHGGRHASPGGSTGADAQHRAAPEQNGAGQDVAESGAERRETARRQGDRRRSAPRWQTTDPHHAPDTGHGGEPGEWQTERRPARPDLTVISGDRTVGSLTGLVPGRRPRHLRQVSGEGF